jgi:hypothetical protein
LKNDSNGKEKLNQLLTLKRNNLSEYIDYWVNLKKDFKELGAYLIIAQFLKNITKKPSKNW